MAEAPDQDTIFKAIADPTRREILSVLVGVRQGMPIGELSEHFPATRQGVTRHIRVLEEAGLVRLEKQGRERLCHADPAALQTVYNWVSVYRQFWAEKLDALGKFLDEAG